MTDEFPSSHDEAFRISGKAFVAKSAMRKLEKGCLTPTIRGDLFQSSDYVYDPYRSPGSGPLENLDFASSEHGEFKIGDRENCPNTAIIVKTAISSWHRPTLPMLNTIMSPCSTA